MGFHCSKSDFLGNVSSDTEERTLYLIVYKDIMERIVKGDKVVEYRECTDYWKKRIEGIPYNRLRITNGYGNNTRPYILLKYMGYDIVERNGTPHYAISINRTLWTEYRDRIGGKVEQC